MGFIERELQRIEAALTAPQSETRYGQLFAAQQALRWTTEPQGFAAPLDMIEGRSGQSATGTPEGTEDCLPSSRQGGS